MRHEPALSTVPPVLPRLPADSIEELEAAVRDEAVAAPLVCTALLFLIIRLCNMWKFCAVS